MSQIDISQRAAFLQMIRSPNKRRYANKTWKDYVVNGLPEQSRKIARRILDLDDFIPESLYYTHWGRGDLLRFDSWSTRNRKTNGIAEKYSGDDHN
jgi:hypothetical protein